METAKSSDVSVGRKISSLHMKIQRDDWTKEETDESTNKTTRLDSKQTEFTRITASRLHIEIVLCLNVTSASLLRWFSLIP